MSRVLNKLNDRMIRGLTTKGRHSDGGGLYLQVAPSGSRSWVYAWKAGAKRTVIGLGGYPTVGLAEARGIAAANRSMVAASTPFRSVGKTKRFRSSRKQSRSFSMHNGSHLGETSSIATNGR